MSSIGDMCVLISYILQAREVVEFTVSSVRVTLPIALNLQSAATQHTLHAIYTL